MIVLYEVCSAEGRVLVCTISEATRRWRVMSGLD